MKTEKHTKIWRLNNMLLNNEWVNDEIKEETKRYFEENEKQDTTTPKERDRTILRENCSERKHFSERKITA